ncbi:MAG TPA: N-6 DNA methylase [Thermoanaerobaculia bacterium]|nr:N-6 DNA methylase [Thermoanaerobaculia bacterium]
MGQFATPAPLAREVVRLGAGQLTGCGAIRFLDPALGSGAFFSALSRELRPPKIEKALGVELDPEIARLAEKLWSPFGLEVREADFTALEVPTSQAEKFDLVVCNPPYVRHHHLSKKAKDRRRSMTRRAIGLDPGGLAGLYCYILLLAHAWMKSEGLGVWLIPSEFQEVRYGQAIRGYMTDKVRVHRVHRFEAQDGQFEDALVTSSVVLLQNVRPRSDDSVLLTEGGTLERPACSREVAVAELQKSPKWTPLFREPERRRRRRTPALLRLGTLFEIKRGVATGANSFFVLERDRATRELKLPQALLRPVLPSPRWLEDSRILADSDGWPRLDTQLALLSCELPRPQIASQYPSLESYLRSGEQDGIPSRYLCRNRSPWYRQEDRPPPPILCSYMGRGSAARAPFRFFRNESKAIATNVYLHLYPRPGLASLVERKPCLLDELVGLLQATSTRVLVETGRSYGGGLRKMEPRELSDLPIDLEEGSLSGVHESLEPQLALFEPRSSVGAG